MSRLLHYTTAPLLTVRSVAQDGPLSQHAKPAGLWLSVEGDEDWRSWCEAEDFGEPGAQLCYEVVLAPDANVLRVETPEALLAFTEEYGCDPYSLGSRFSGHGIRWPEVAEKYAGIIIAPYQWSLRLDDRTCWYYGWDCASGCIWRAEAVAEVLRVPTPAPPVTP